jgi:hypothetical protein
MIQLQIPEAQYLQHLPVPLWEGNIQGTTHRAVVVPTPGYDYAVSIEQRQDHRWVKTQSPNEQMAVLVHVVGLLAQASTRTA